MAKSIVSTKRLGSQFIDWLLEEDRGEKEGPYRKEEPHRQHSWWQVMCLTGVDYFSTLGYQPGIAALAAGALSPVATLILVLLTLFGALPIYRRIAAESPHGEGSIAMLERLLPWWQGKLLVLCLLGFVATDFIITITLSAADATAHIIENPLTPNWFHNQTIAITLILVALLGGVFLRGFKEAIGIAVVLVAVYLLLNFVVVSLGLDQILTHPEAIANWQTALFARHSNPLILVGIALLIGTIIFTSLVSRVWRSTELRAERIEVDELVGQFLAEESQGVIRLIANRLNAGDVQEYFMKEKEVREDNHIPPNDPILFLEIMVSDASEFADIIKVKGVQVGDYRILRAESAAVPNAIAALLLYIRDQTGKIPHAYFGWVEGNPIQYLLRFILFGEGDIAVVTREVLRRAENDPHKRPGVHVGG
jgi:hypothetical protein